MGNKLKISLSALTIAGTLMVFAPVQAHHSIVGEFDTSSEVSLRGALTELEWFNPHIWIYLDVTTDNGSVEKWQCEMGAPNRLLRAGWRKEDLPIGTVIRFVGNPARDGSNTCSTRSITLDDGTPVFDR